MAKSNAARSAARATTPPAQTPKKNAKTASTAMELDSLIHERVRLAIVSALAANQSLSFVELKDLLNTTDGNLSVHARKLEEAGYIACDKSFEDRKPRTEFRLLPVGKRALERYLNHMEALIRATKR